ncbi:O-antigen ligase family protein [Myxococcota bacterium]|nr:O-antigen ligase family protein [Myxococcota bacterium]
MPRLDPRLLPASVMVGLGLGTFGTELTTGLALAGALLWGDRRRGASLAGPVLLLAACFLLAAPLGGPDAWREVLGRAWPLAPLLALPALATDRDPAVERLGLLAALLPALWGLGQALVFDTPGRGPFSHHLTLGYALVPPLAVAAHRRRGVLATLLAAGVASTGGSGPLLAAGVALAGALLLPPAGALVGGTLLALGAIGLGARADLPALHERAVLWATGGSLALQHPVGTGTGAFRAAAAHAQQAIEPGFHFPLHAHDSALQLAALVGLGGWLALAWLAWSLWSRADRAGRATLAALAVGGLTQDLLGDMEVARAAAAWLAWSTLAGRPLAVGAPPGEPEHPTAVG